MGTKKTEKIGDFRLVFLEKGFVYDGSQIMPHWAQDKLGVGGDSLVCFRGKMRVPRENMVDNADLAREQGDVLISSDDSINFVAEHFFEKPDLALGYCFLRLLAFVSKEELEKACGVVLRRDGTDLFLGNKKINVGVATMGPDSLKLHFAVNVSIRGVPGLVENKVACLEDLGLKEEPEVFMEKIAKKYLSELLDVERDVGKTRVF